MNRSGYALVLSGGGAKGAYQAGVLRALVEMEVGIEAVAGTSIGALNGAIVASAPNLATASERLGLLWAELGRSSPLSVDAVGSARILAAINERLSKKGLLMTGQRLVNRFMKDQLGVSSFPQGENQPGRVSAGVCSDEPLNLLMDKFLDDEGLEKGLPLYVALFEHTDSLDDLLIHGLGGITRVPAVFGLDTPPSEFFHVQLLPRAERRQALLASAALPAIFAPKEVQGKLYNDGGMGGMTKSQGNTPIQPLLDAGYRRFIVTHLEDGALWSRWDFDHDGIIEIRPKQLSFQGTFDLMAFDKESIQRWMEEGYEDTLRCVGRVLQVAGSFAGMRASERLRDQAEALSQASDALRRQAVDRLR